MPRFLNLSWVTSIFLMAITVYMQKGGIVGWVTILDPRLFFAVFVFIYLSPALASSIISWGSVKKSKTNKLIAIIVIVVNIYLVLFGYFEYYLSFVVGFYGLSLMILAPMIALVTASVLQYRFNGCQVKENTKLA